jgi:hypothetical protein
MMANKANLKTGTIWSASGHRYVGGGRGNRGICRKGKVGRLRVGFGYLDDLRCMGNAWVQREILHTCLDWDRNMGL